PSTAHLDVLSFPTRRSSDLGQLPTWRARLVLVMLLAGFAALAGRALYLQGLSTEFLQQQGERRYERTLTLSATRGKILDRNGVVVRNSTRLNSSHVKISYAV